MTAQQPSATVHYRAARSEDLQALLAIEQQCFQGDRLSERSFRRWIQSKHGILLLAEHQQQILGYGLVWCHKGTRLARLYSLAVPEQARGQGIATGLMRRLQQAAAEQGHLFMRLEVAKTNPLAIRLYQREGYHVFGEYHDYYDDHADALRMQKTIQTLDETRLLNRTPWYQQTTEFTCGPAALMMAMSSLDSQIEPNVGLELDLWREATTIFMTSGHGGCHPVGLALAAERRGFQVSVSLNSDQPLFIDGVRVAHKKEVMTLVHQQFIERAQACSVELCYQELTQQQLWEWMEQGYAVLLLISTYRMDGRKAPHWVTLTAMDERCLYVHDPDPDMPQQRAIDCQYLPIAREDFVKMSGFGSSRLRTAVALRPKKEI